MDSQQTDGYRAGFVTQLDQILEALRLVHNARSSNEVRHRASQYLEQIREDVRAPEQGFLLASSRDQTPIVRHYGLSLIDHAIRYKWQDYTREQSTAVREWVLKLADDSPDQDPPYIINKIAELWVEIAKRSWAVDWMDMDELLVRLWQGHSAQKLLVLNILETMFDEVFTTEDSVAALRGSDLNRACIEICIPAHVLTEQFPNREASVNVRYGTDGWTSRLSSLLLESINQSHIDRPQELITLKALSAYKSVVTWVVPKALVVTASVDRICACLAVSNIAVQLVSNYLPLILATCS